MTDTDEIKQYQVTWTVTVHSDSPDGAKETASDMLAENDIEPEVEEVIDCCPQCGQPQCACSEEPQRVFNANGIVIEEWSASGRTIL
jgi:hypothetical protein